MVNKYNNFRFIQESLLLEALKVRDEPVDSRGGGYGIFEKIFPPSKFTLPLHKFITEFQKNIPAP